MLKKRAFPPDGLVRAGPSSPSAAIGDAGARKPVVRGLGVLADSGLELEAGIDLLEPIAEQVFARRGRSRVR